MDTDSFIVHIKTGDIHKNILEDVETRFDASSHNVNRQLPMEKKTRKVLGLMKDEQGGQIMKKFNKQ